MKFSKSEDLIINIKYNSILVIIDKLTKYIYLISYNKKFMTKQIIQIILDKVIRYYEILKNIMLNKDKIFTSNF